MRMRKALSKRVRFQVFDRDGHTCHYCGATPPDTKLEIDHIVPVARGGNNCERNLVTACVDCNAGKSDTLASIPIWRRLQVAIDTARSWGVPDADIGWALSQSTSSLDLLAILFGLTDGAQAREGV